MGRAHLAVALLAGVTAGCSRSGRAPDRFPGAPIVIVSIDTLRADHLPAYGYAAVETPHVDALRRDAILFRNAYTHVPLTLPAHASAFTGLLPPGHGVRDNLGYRVSESRATLASLLKDKGYATGAAVSAFVLHASTGIARGFEFYEDAMEAPAGSDALAQVQRPGGSSARLALRWLAGVQGKPFLLFLHIYEPHSPFEPPEPFKSRYPLAYDGEVAAADAILGDFIAGLKSAGVYDPSLVVLLSDHGEGLGDHGEEFHGILLYREALHVPLLMKLPASTRAGEEIATPVQLVDLLPTVAELLDLPRPPGLDGRSLLDPKPRPRRLYAETHYPRVHLGWSSLRALIDDRFHYIDGPRPELFNLLADPQERRDLLASEGGVAEAMKKELANYPADFEAPDSATPEEREKLAALGYLGGAATAPDGPLPDPKASIHLLAEVKDAFKLTQAGRDAEAVVALRRILEKSPLFLDVRYQLAQTLVRLGRHEEAYEAYTTALRGSPSLAGPIGLALARVCLELGRVDEAEANARLGLRTNAGQAHELLARVALARNDLAGTESEAKQAVGDPVAESNRVLLLAEVHIRRDEPDQALSLLETERRRLTERHSPPLRDLEYLRGDALARLGRHADAAAAFDAEIRAFPANAQAYARLAIVYGLQHRTFGEVDRLLERMVAAQPSARTMLLAAKTLDSMGDAKGAAAWRRKAQAAGARG
jgi:choline-sulfatase